MENNTLNTGSQHFTDEIPPPVNRIEGQIINAVQEAWWHGATYVIANLVDVLGERDLSVPEHLTQITCQLLKWSTEISERRQARE
jgi:hypothetical protein